MALTKTTRLDAVNKMLLGALIDPVATLEYTGDIDVEKAKGILDTITLEVETIGWSFNTLIFNITPDTNNEIVIPDSYISVDPTDRSLNYIVRAGKLYDKEENTFKFTDPVKLKVTTIEEFEDIPQVARYYIAILATRKFQQNAQGDRQLDNDINKDEAQAWLNLQQYEINNKDYNFIQNSPHGVNISGKYYNQY